MTYLGMNLKYEQDLYTEKYIGLPRGLKKTGINGERDAVLGWKDSILLEC